MPKPSQCIVDGCPNPSHAKGYCRRHYGQIWRKGMIYNTSPSDRSEAEARLRGDHNERLRSLERELKKTQQMYDVVVGFQGRIKWRREIEAVEMEIRKLMEAEVKADAAKLVDAPASSERTGERTSAPAQVLSLETKAS